MTSKITVDHLDRRAIVYVRQSTLTQLMQNRESQRRQYALADHARGLGFCNIETIDEDLGRSGSGLVERPGFQRLVTKVCAGAVGAIFCIEASRLARNGRDWHHLIELCGLVGTVIVDPEGVYDPRLSNDRLLLGLKGTMSEFELNLFRQRSEEAIRQKARRGELQFLLPIGLCWTSDGRIELDPDIRVQNSLRLVFRKFQELRSARAVFLWFKDEELSVPATKREEPVSQRTYWRRPVYHTILAILTNPFYAGAYAFGRSGVRTRIVDGVPRKTGGHRKSREHWVVLIRDHHPGYIGWEQYERNQALLAENAHRKPAVGRKSARGGKALLAGLLRCRRCGRMLQVRYHKSPRYLCCNGNISQGAERCIAFGALRPDQAVSSEILKVVDGCSIEAAVKASEEAEQQRHDRRQALELELEQARYEARLAARRYEAIDPDNRLVAAELESRWNSALRVVKELEQKLGRFDAAVARSIPDKATLSRLAYDMPAIWNAPSTDTKLKQRIIRILIQEIVADIDEKSDTILLVIHWIGGRHSELRVLKNRTGRHSRCTDLEAVEIVRRMATSYSDEQIAVTLNKLGLRTGAGNRWNLVRVRSLRNYLGIPSYDPENQDKSKLTMQEAAERLSVSPKTVRRLVELKILPATQIVSFAPWEIPADAIKLPSVIQAALDFKSRGRNARNKRRGAGSLRLPGF